MIGILIMDTKTKIRFSVFFLTLFAGSLSNTLSGMTNPAKTPIAIINLSEGDHNKAVSEYCAGLFYGKMTREGPFKVYERQQVDAILKEHEGILSGCFDNQCAAEFGKMIGVDRIILLRCLSFGNRRILNLRDIDIHTTENALISQHFGGKNTLFQKQVNGFIRSMFKEEYVARNNTEALKYSGFAFSLPKPSLECFAIFQDNDNPPLIGMGSQFSLTFRKGLIGISGNILVPFPQKIRNTYVFNNRLLSPNTKFTPYLSTVSLYKDFILSRWSLTPEFSVGTWDIIGPPSKILGISLSLQRLILFNPKDRSLSFFHYGFRTQIFLSQKNFSWKGISIGLVAGLTGELL